MNLLTVILIILIIFLIIKITPTIISKFKDKLDDYVIAIPSYDRVNKIGTHTLEFLRKQEIPIEKITIFVADQEQHDIYKEKYPKYKIVIGEKGIKNIRNFIIDYYDEGKYVVSMDDDVMDIRKATSKTHMKDVDNFNEFIENAFETCKEKNARIWGLSPYSNPIRMFHKKPITEGLSFIAATCFGFINDKSIKVNIDIKEDIELSILYFQKYRNVIRFEHYGIKTEARASGGLQSVGRDFESEERSAQYLTETYPDYVKNYTITKKGLPYVHLKTHRYKPKPIPEPN